MADPREIDALKASFRGLLTTASALDARKDRVAGMSAAVEPAADDLQELLAVVAAHAVAAAAVRGMLVGMLERRGIGRGQPAGDG
jgi:hypothetical protein